ncbi:MAG: hypothetical protein IT369_22765 [Candidatus Latescibacteria bacterium]|jgi:hypothetical protein|nr:hypothetical protein [Candidatus Latescibacterota bacterium]
MSESRHRRRHSRKRRPPNYRIYAIITLACGLLALLVQLALDATTKVKDLADQTADSMVRDVVKDQIKNEIKGGR